MTGNHDTTSDLRSGVPPAAVPPAEPQLNPVKTSPPCYHGAEKAFKNWGRRAPSFPQPNGDIPTRWLASLGAMARRRPEKITKRRGAAGSRRLAGNSVASRENNIILFLSRVSFFFPLGRGGGAGEGFGNGVKSFLR